MVAKCIKELLLEMIAELKKWEHNVVIGVERLTSVIKLTLKRVAYNVV